MRRCEVTLNILLWICWAGGNKEAQVIESLVLWVKHGSCSRWSHMSVRWNHMTLWPDLEDKLNHNRVACCRASRNLRFEGKTGGRDGKHTSDFRVIQLTAIIKWPQRGKHYVNHRTVRYWGCTELAGIDVKWSRTNNRGSQSDRFSMIQQQFKIQFNNSSEYFFFAQIDCWIGSNSDPPLVQLWA